MREVARRQPRQQRQRDVADQPVHRHGAPVARPGEAVPLGVVGGAGHDRQRAGAAGRRDPSGRRRPSRRSRRRPARARGGSRSRSPRRHRGCAGGSASRSTRRLPRPTDRRPMRCASAPVPSVLASSTTMMWSTNPGTERIAAAILSASLYAGMTTATFEPRNIPQRRARAGRSCQRSIRRGLTISPLRPPRAPRRVLAVALGLGQRIGALVAGRRLLRLGRGRGCGRRLGRRLLLRGYLQRLEVDRDRRVGGDDLLVVLVARLLQHHLHRADAVEIDRQADRASRRPAWLLPSRKMSAPGGSDFT